MDRAEQEKRVSEESAFKRSLVLSKRLCTGSYIRLAVQTAGIGM